MDNKNANEKRIIDAAEYVIVTCADDTISGQMYFYPDEIPENIMNKYEFVRYSNEICSVIFKYKSVCDVFTEPDGAIDINLGWDYCPHYEPISSDIGFEENREIKNPLEHY